MHFIPAFCLQFHMQWSIILVQNILKVIFLIVSIVGWCIQRPAFAWTLELFNKTLKQSAAQEGRRLHYCSISRLSVWLMTSRPCIIPLFLFIVFMTWITAQKVCTVSYIYFKSLFKCQLLLWLCISSRTYTFKTHKTQGWSLHTRHLCMFFNAVFRSQSKCFKCWIAWKAIKAVHTIQQRYSMKIRRLLEIAKSITTKYF